MSEPPESSPGRSITAASVCQNRSFDVASWLLLGGLVLFAYGLIPQLGVSWDEHFHLRWGAEKWDNYQALFSGERTWQEFARLQHSSVHPGFFDLAVQALLRFAPLDPNEASHWMSFVFGWFGLLAVWLTGRCLLGPMGGFCALLLLVATPRYFGHLWFNPKDIPFAACYAWCLYFLLQVVQSFPHPKWWKVVALGALTGFALGVRIAGLLIPLYFGAACVVYLLVASRPNRRLVKDSVSLSGRGILAAFFAYLCALPFWPALWKSPALGVSESAGMAQGFGWDGPVLYSGAFERSTDLPWHYLPKWIAITLPEWTLILLVVGVGLAPWVLWIQSRSGDFAPWIRWGLVALAAVFPVVYVILTGPTLYDGMRHFIFVLPPLILMATGVVFLFVHALRQMDRVPRRLACLPVVLTILCCLKTVSLDYSRLCPYYYVYFNGWVGGLGGAYNNYETDYWGLSYREAVESLSDYVAELVPKDSDEPWKLAMSGAGFLVGPFLPDNIVLSGDRETADFYMAYTRVNQHTEGVGEIIHIVSREGVPLNVVWDQRRVSDREGVFLTE